MTLFTRLYQAYFFLSGYIGKVKILGRGRWFSMFRLSNILLSNMRRYLILCLGGAGLVWSGLVWRGKLPHLCRGFNKARLWNSSLRCPGTAYFSWFILNCYDQAELFVQCFLKWFTALMDQRQMPPGLAWEPVLVRDFSMFLLLQSTYWNYSRRFLGCMLLPRSLNMGMDNKLFVRTFMH